MKEGLGEGYEDCAPSHHISSLLVTTHKARRGFEQAACFSGSHNLSLEGLVVKDEIGGEEKGWLWTNRIGLR